MRKFKILMAVMVSMLAFGLTSYAATFNFDENVVVENNTATVTLKLDPNTTIPSVGEACAMSFEIGDGLGFEIAEEETITEPNGKGYWISLDENLFLWTYEETIEFTDPSEYAFKMTFTLKESGDRTVTLRINDETYYCDGEGGDIEGVEEVSITIPSSEPPVTPEPPVDPEPPVQEEPEAGDIKTEETVLSENKKFLEIYDNNTQPRYVAIEEKSDVAVTATTVLKATYNGTTKQANLYNLLGVDEEARGNITIGKLTIKMVLPLNSAQPTDSIFNFVIQ